MEAVQHSVFQQLFVFYHCAFSSLALTGPMSPSRDPLGSLSANCLPTYSPTPHAKPVYPIFLTRKAVASRCHPSDVASASVLGKTSCDEQKHRTDRKRVKTSCSHPADDKSFDRIDGSRRFSIPDYFNPRTSIRASCAPPILKAEPEKQGNAVWKRRRGRLGCGLSSQADRK